MPLWVLFSLTFLILAVAAAGTVWYFAHIVLVGLLSGAAYLEVSTQSGVIAVALLVVVAVIFIFLGRTLVVPIRRLTRAVELFRSKGGAVPVIVPSFAPREIRDLARSFIGLMGSVEAVHNRDTEVSRVKSDFISTAAHQLRTPLTSIRWALEALEKGDMSEDQRELIKNAADKSRELIGIVGTLLDISAIESGKYKYTFAATDVNELVNEVGRDLAELAKSRNISLLRVPGEPLPAVRMDRERVKWVLNNLVENAIRYTPDGGTVRLATARGPEIIFVTVRDNGIGIDPRDRGNIFERFYRAQNAIAKESQGNGLGLYIARTIATDHGGDLNFEANKEGPGTTFTLSLPVAGPRTQS